MVAVVPEVTVVGAVALVTVGALVVVVPPGSPGSVPSPQDAAAKARSTRRRRAARVTEAILAHTPLAAGGADVGGA